MRIGFNPAIKNQNTYSVKHNASEHTSISNNQLAFKNVNQKYYDMAEKMYKDWGCILSELLTEIEDDMVFNIISKQDALDTMNSVRKWVDKKSLKAFETSYNFIKDY